MSLNGRLDTLGSRITPASVVFCPVGYRHIWFNHVLLVSWVRHVMSCGAVVRPKNGDGLQNGATAVVLCSWMAESITMMKLVRFNVCALGFSKMLLHSLLTFLKLARKLVVITTYG